jgi:hypothetical protein
VEEGAQITDRNKEGGQRQITYSYSSPHLNADMLTQVGAPTLKYMP